jgi:hypothetical protein
LLHHLFDERNKSSSFQPAAFSFIQAAFADVAVRENGRWPGNHQVYAFPGEIIGEERRVV